MEIPEWLVLPVFSGAIALALIVPKSNSRLDTSEKFIVTSAVLGLIPALIVLMVKDKFKFYVPFSGGVVSLFNLIITSILAYIFQYFLTRNVDEITEESSQISNQLEKEIVRAINLNNKVSDSVKSYDDLIEHLIELKNGKVYVGLIVYIDIKDSSPISEKFLSFIPTKSGYRKKDGSVEYNSFYYPAIKADQSLENYEKAFDDVASSIKSIFVPFGEVISIREYNLKINDLFGHT